MIVLFGGAIVDRLPRRRVILATDLASGVVVGVVAVLGLTHHLQIGHLYAASALFGVAFSFHQPAMSAIMPELVPKDVLIAGNSLRSLGSQMSHVLGPLAGGVVVTTAGPSAAFAIDAATFFFSFFVFFLSRPPVHEPPAPRPLLAQMREGVAFSFSKPWLWVAIVGFGITNGFYFAAFTVALPLLVTKVLMGGAITYGLLGAAGGVGELAAGFVVGNMKIRRMGIAMYVGNAVIGVSALAYGVPLLPVVLLGAAGFGAGIVASNTVWESSLQKHVPPSLIGRVTSVDYFGSFLVGPVAPIAAGVAVPVVGPGAIFVIGGVVSILLSVFAPLMSRSIRELE